MCNRLKYAPKLLSLCSLIFVLVMILSGCTTKQSTVPNVPYQENLLTKCPTTLPKLNGNTGADLATALLEYVEIYGKCAVRHNQLTDEIRQRMEK